MGFRFCKVLLKHSTLICLRIIYDQIFTKKAELSSYDRQPKVFSVLPFVKKFANPWSRVCVALKQ